MSGKVKGYLRKIKRPIIVLGILFFLLTFLFGLILENNVFELKTTLMSIVQDFIDQLMEEESGIIENGNISPIGLILNNSRVALTAFLSGLIPFLFLPLIVLIVNALVLGVAIPMIAEVGGISVIKLFLLGILPHGIFELSSIILAVALGFKLCLTITQAIVSKKKTMTVKEAFISGGATLVTVCIPLMIIAGFIEAYITPMLLN